MPEYVKTILICASAVALGTFLGNGAVYFFNKIPAVWLTDYGEEPSEELLHPTVQRVKSTPWKYVFSGLFIIIGIKLGMENPAYGLAALIACWLLLEMAIADVKYMIVPDQLIFLLVITAFGFLPYHVNGPMECLWGALIGFGVMLVIGVFGKLFYKNETLGGADIKIFGALGLSMGIDGIIWILVMTTLISAGHMFYLLIRKKIKLTDRRPMVPYIAISSGIYMVLLHEISYNILIAI